MKTSCIIKPKVGDKNILLEPISDGMCLVTCPCGITGTPVKFLITEAQAEEILSEDRRNIAEILPNTPAPLREIFLTGLTPEEFSRTLDGEEFEDDDEGEWEVE